LTDAGIMSAMTDRDRTVVAAWLFLCAALAFAVVLVGGVTRLTRSGLSIVEWQPLIGILPPLSQEAWEALFAKYRETPEFRQVNSNMTLDGFKGIFWWEYTHRLLARAIGFVYVVPLLFFQWRKMLTFATVKLWAIFVLARCRGARLVHGEVGQ
jgi:cytochrome c oxidase assembly protein subunit 15